MVLRRISPGLKPRAVFQTAKHSSLATTIPCSFRTIAGLALERDAPSITCTSFVPDTPIPWPKVPLDEKFYSLQADELAFFKTETGIRDKEKLKKHIMNVQAEAYYDVHPYPCIRRFAFTKLKISRHPSYRNFLTLGKERIDARFLDVGCCMGTDVRKVVSDGFPIDQVYASDLRPEFWKLGHKLFRTTPRTFPVTFIPGNALDPAFLSNAPPNDSPFTSRSPLTTNLKTLTPLQGRISALHASSLFHLFDEPKQLALARGLASLLSPEPGSIIFGTHSARPERGTRPEILRTLTQKVPLFSHSPDSWKEMWEMVFRSEVKVSTRLIEVEREDMKHWDVPKFWALVWSVTRM